MKTPNPIHRSTHELVLSKPKTPMKIHRIDPNKLRTTGQVASFTIEYRFQYIPVLDGGPHCQRFMRLTEVRDMTGSNAALRRTVWHEIYSHDICSAGRFSQWCSDKGSMFQWFGKQKEFLALVSQMADMASKEQVEKSRAE